MARDLFVATIALFAGFCPEDLRVCVSTVERQARLDRYGDPLPFGALARLGTQRLRHAGTVNTVAFTPDGKLLISAGDDCIIRFWDTLNGRRLLELRGHAGYVSRVAVAPSGRTLASTSSDGSVRLWEIATGRQLWSSAANGCPIDSVAFAPDGNSLIWGDRAGTIKCWEVGSEKGLRQWRGHQAVVTALAFLPDGKSVVSGSDDKALRWWESGSGNLIRKVDSFAGPVTSLAVSPNGNLMAVGLDAESDSLWVFDAKLGRVISKSSGQLGPIRAVAFLSERQLVASTLNGIHVCDVSAQVENQRIHPTHGVAHALATAPDGRAIAFGDSDGLVHLCDVVSWKNLCPIEGHHGPVTSLAFSDDSQTVVSASGENTIQVWNTVSGRLSQREWQARGHIEHLPFSVHSVAFGRSKDAVVSASNGLSIFETWKLSTSELEFPSSDQIPPAFNTTKTHRLAVSIIGTKLAVLNGRKGIVIWDLCGNREFASISIGQREIFSLAFTHDGTTLAVGTGELWPAFNFDNSAPCEVQLWDVAKSQVFRTLLGARGPAYSVAFAPDGRTVAAACQDGTVRLWNPITGELKQVLTDGSQAILTIAFSPDGRSLAAAGEDSRVLLWELASGKLRKHWVGHQGRIHHVAFSMDGKTLASGSADTTILLWDVLGLQTEPLPPKPTTAQDWEALWNALTDANATAAYLAVRTLIAYPAETVPFLAQLLKPGQERVSAERLAELITALDSPQYAMRNQATMELEKLDEAAEPTLRQALAKAPSLEMKRVLRSLLQKLNGPTTAPDQLQLIRAVEALEQIDNSAARQLLEKLSKGAPTARCTRDAKASLERLASRK